MSVSFSGDFSSVPNDALRYVDDATTGLMWLTLTNSTASNFTGTFFIQNSVLVAVASPVPEPASCASLLAGLGVMFTLSRREKKAHAASEPALA